MTSKKYEDMCDFETAFYEDVESWFSADIACCDNCYKDFLRTWPLAYLANEAKFQKNGIDLDSFYEGSRLQDIYTQDEFDYFIKKINCPRCGTPLTDNIWLYDLPFDKDAKIESVINDIAAIASKTPFLLLKHPFSKSILTTIRNISDISKATVLNEPLFRARAGKIPNPTQDDFDFPPKEYVKEGRYNHAGLPVLYLASNKNTCFYEMRQCTCTIAEIKVLTQIKVLDLINIEEYQGPDENILKTLVYSALISSKQEDEGWYKPQYVFSRFVTDCALDTGFQAIRYPSTRLSTSNYNLVIIDPSITLANDCSIYQYFVVNPIDDV